MPDPCDISIIGTGCAAYNLGSAAADAAARDVAGSVFDDMAESAGRWAGEMVVHAMTWWVRTPTVNPDSTAVRNAQEWTIPIVLFMLVGSLLWQAGRMILTRKRDPLVNIAAGLTRYLVVATLSLSVLGAAVRAGDALATAMVGDSAQQFGQDMQNVMTLAMINNPFGLLVLGLLLGLIALVQWVIGFMRQAGILILAALIPLAASGSLNDSTRTWWPKLATSCLALVVYKPVAAIIYMIGFTFLGQGEDLSTVMVGCMVLLASLFALPALMKFFSWAETRVGGSGGSGGGFVGAAGALAMAGGAAGGGRGGSAASTASVLQATGPGSQGGSSAGAFGAVPGGSTRPSAAATATGPAASGGQFSDSSSPSGSASSGGRSNRGWGRGGPAGLSGHPSGRQPDVVHHATTRCRWGAKSMTAVTSPTETPTYGNWRRARGLGLGQLTGGQTVLLVACALVPILWVYTVGFPSALAVIAVAVVMALLLVVRVRGTTAADIISRAVRFQIVRRRRWSDLSGGVLTDHPRRHDLPGVMAPMVPLSTDDGRGGTQGMLWHRRSGHLTVVLTASPLGIELADTADSDQWVANWGAFLSDLGYRPMVRHVAVTVDTFPSGGSTSRDYIAERIDPDAPRAAQEVMRELIVMTPETVADVDTRIAITFDPAAANPRPDNLLDAAAEVTRWLPGIEQMLAPCGIAITGRLTADQIVATLRTAYDPASRADVARKRDSGNEMLRWEEAGPVRAVEDWDYWQHDSALSVSWALAEAPRQAVISRVLLPLIAPGPYARRATLLYEPVPAEEAAERLESEVRAMGARQALARRTKRDVTQRDRDDEARAVQATREESAGSGVGRFTLYASTSVPNMEHLSAAIADVEQRAGQAKLRLRRLRGAHAAGFAAALGLGINPSVTAYRGRR